MITADAIVELLATDPFATHQLYERVGVSLRAGRIAAEASRVLASRGAHLGTDEDPDAIISWSKHDFESEVLGVETHRVSTPVTRLGLDRVAATAHLGLVVLGDLAVQGSALAIVRVSTADAGALAGLQRAGFAVVECGSLWITVPQPSLAPPKVPGYRIELLDRSALAELPRAAYERIVDHAAHAFPRSHFHADQRLAPGRCDDLYRSWAARTISGAWADRCVVVWDVDQVVGFLGFTLERIDGDRGTETKVAGSAFGLASPTARAGVGTAMYRTAIRSLDADVIEMGTQVNNHLMRVFGREGLFDSFASYFTLHGWAGGTT